LPLHARDRATAVRAPDTGIFNEGEMMKSIVIAAAVAVGVLAAGMANAQDSAALAQKSGCMTCHAVDTKKMGPSFKESAAKLKGKSDADVLAAIKGSKAHGGVKAPDADLTALGKWIQTL
jgi:cytochrome c